LPSSCDVLAPAKADEAGNPVVAAARVPQGIPLPVRMNLPVVILLPIVL